MSKRPRVLVMHAIVRPHGGACGVPVWTLQALRESFEVTLLTSSPLDLPALNRYFGTSLESGDFSIRTIPLAVRKILSLDPDPGSVQQHCYLMRMAKRLRKDFDAAISTDNEADLGAPALQYIHVPALHHVYPQVLANLDLPLSAKVSAWRAGKLRPWMMLADFSFDRMKRNRTLVNSDWTGGWVRRLYGIEPIRLYPPAPGSFPEIPWGDREDGFVMLGRLDADKRPDWCLRVLSAVRRRFPQLKLHLIGSRGRGQSAYYKNLLALISANSSWVTLHENVSRQEIQRLLASQKYGFHATIDEHFGMAVAEMVRAGCLPFVHDSGGAPGTVSHDPRLIYGAAEEAVEKILAVIGDPAMQAGLTAKLRVRADLYRPEVFTDGIRRNVQEMLAGSARFQCDR